MVFVLMVFVLVMPCTLALPVMCQNALTIVVALTMVIVTWKDISVNVMGDTEVCVLVVESQSMTFDLNQN